MKRSALLWAALLLPAPTAAGERWVKLDRAGRPMAATQGPWACVLDQQTGLVWENLSDNEGSHYAQATYSWFDPQHPGGRAQGGSCMRADGKVFACDTAMQKAAAQAAGWCGRSDWRLPTLAELRSLLWDTGFAGAARIAHGYFPHTQRAPYWSATLRSAGGGRSEVAALHFGNGSTAWLEARRAARLRLVSPALAAQPARR